MSQNIQNLQMQPQYQYRTQNGIEQKSPTNFSANGKPLSNGAAIVENNALSKTSKKMEENASDSFVMGLGATGGILALSEFLNRGLQKDYDSSFLGKVEKGIQRFENGATGQKVVSGLKTGINFVKTKASNVIDNSKILTALFKKPSIGGSMVQGQAAGSMGHISSRAVEVLKKYVEDVAKGKITLSDTKLNSINALLSRVEKDPYKHTKEIIKFIKDNPLGLDLNHAIERPTWWSFKLLKNKNNLQEILNKYELINKYKTGNSLASRITGFLFRGAEGLTNGMLAGLGSVLMQGMWVAMSVNEGRKAEKGEKFQTFAASLAELMAMTSTAGLQMKLLNHVAGLKFTGMEIPASDYQALIERINTAAKSGNATVYNTLMSQLKNAKAIQKRNLRWYHKPFKLLGDLLSFGRIKETVKPLSTGTAGSILKKIPYGLKVGVGYVGRVALIFGVIIPLFQKVARGLSHAIFGKPVKTIEREKRKELEEKMKAEQEANAQNQPQQPAQQVSPAQQPVPVQQPSKPGNLVDQMNQMYNQRNHNQQQMQQQIPQQNMQNPMNPQAPLGAQTMMPQQPQASTPVSPEAHIKRTYLPNPVLGPEAPINPASTRSAEIDRIMRQADLAEAQAHKLGV